MKTNLLIIGMKYTYFHISSMALTTKVEITIVDIQDGRGVFKQRGKRKAFYLPEETILLFKGWDLPIKSDFDTGNFRGNACYNLIAESATFLRNFIINNCIGFEDLPDSEIGRILYIRNSNQELSKQQEFVLFPEADIQHAIIERIKMKNKALN